MNHAEEQSLEMEALAAIFLEQFTQESPVKCTVIAEPNADQVHISCALEWTMPPTYPDVVPELTIRDIKGMDNAWLQQLRDQLLLSAKDMLGAPMLFSLIEMAKEWLTDRNVAGVAAGSMHAKMLAKEIEKQKDIEKEQQQQKQLQRGKGGKDSEKSDKLKKIEAGTPVTAESFSKWMIAFIKEEASSQVITESASKLTGRQLFERGSLKPEEEEVVAGDVEDFDRNLIMDEDVDLDMLEDDEEDEDVNEEEEAGTNN